MKCFLGLNINSLKFVTSDNFRSVINNLTGVRMKIYSIALVSLFVLAACQKAPNRAADAAAKPQDKVVNPVATPVTKTLMECVTKEAFKDTDKEGNVRNTTSETTMKTISVLELIEKKDGLNHYNISGEYVSEQVDTNEKGEKQPAYKVDYTYAGTRTSKTQEIDSKNYKVFVTRKLTQTGRNGFQFYVAKDKPKSDSRTLESQLEMTTFDDGAVTYVTDYNYTSNGKTTNFEQSGLGNFITNYTTEGAVTKNVTTLKQPVVKKYEDGSINELTSSEETCTETSEKSAKR